MKQTEVGQRVLTGQIVMVGEFRDWEVRTVGVNGKANVVETTFVACGRDIVEVQHWRERGHTADKSVRPALKPGDKVACVIQPERTRFGTRAKGVVEPLVA